MGSGWCNSHSQLCGKTSSSESLSAAELNTAETLWLAIMQSHTFQEELELLRKKKAIPNASSLCTLHPLLDNLGLLQVGGRLANS